MNILHIFLLLYQFHLHVNLIYLYSILSFSITVSMYTS